MSSQPNDLAHPRPKRSLARRFASALRSVIYAPFAGIAAACGLKIARFSNPRRIGHMAAEMDCFLKERALGLIPDTRPVLLIDRSAAGNRALLDLFKRHVAVLDKRWQKILFMPLTKFDAIHLPLGRPVVALNESARYSQVLALWEDRPPVIRLSETIERDGAALIRELGVPEGAWFVCLHAREAGYSPGDDIDHAHRNCDIETYRPAIEAITARGGWVVRVGDPTMSPLTAMANVVDYALSPLRRDWMDLWLCAHNRFFIGTTSGLTMVATMFHKPCALVNMIPYGASYGMSRHDISIPKDLRGPDGAPLSFAEIWAAGLSTLRYSQHYAQSGITVVDNTGQQIQALVEEMLDRLDGTFEVTDDDEDLQRRFRSLLEARDYCFGSPALIGRDWLRQNRDRLR